MKTLKKKIMQQIINYKFVRKFMKFLSIFREYDEKIMNF